MSAAFDDVTPDGSPVAVYLAVPAGEAPSLIHDAVVPGGSILELGCGAGRVTRPLVALGHAVVAVDESAAMLEHVTGAEKVCADFFTLDLGRTFDAVVAGSYLIHVPDRSRRQELLRVARQHVKGDGVVLVQRWDPEWMATTVNSDRTVGPVFISYRVLERRDHELDAATTFRVGDRSWTQTYTAAVVDDDELAENAVACGLAFDGWLDDDRTWARLRPRTDASRLSLAAGLS
jgi:SAM-dependent methyltransferase